MQTKNPLLDDMAQLMTGALGAAQSVGEEARALARAQVDRLIADMDLVGREEFEATKAMLNAAREEIAALKAEVNALKAHSTQDGSENA
ncbi:MAG: accessory factor UbiK family protein [Maricaulaceae bacterium]